MAAAKYDQKPSPPTWPIMMFCGLPMRVVAEPALLAAARPNKNGRASSLRAARPAHSSGVMANTTMSLTRNADSAPPIAMVKASRRNGRPACRAIQAAAAS